MKEQRLRDYLGNQFFTQGSDPPPNLMAELGVGVLLGYALALDQVCYWFQLGPYA